MTFAEWEFRRSELDCPRVSVIVKPAKSRARAPAEREGRRLADLHAATRPFPRADSRMRWRWCGLLDYCPELLRRALLQLSPTAWRQSLLSREFALVLGADTRLKLHQPLEATRQCPTNK
jgi:hypothetical protein